MNLCSWLLLINACICGHNGIYWGMCNVSTRTGYREGRWPSGRAEALEPGGRGSIPRLGSRRSSLISIEHAELLRSTHSLVMCCARLVTMALHVHCGLGQLSPLPTSGDDKWVAAKHCGWAKWSRISDTHRLRSSLQFRYINNQSLLHFTYIHVHGSSNCSGSSNRICCGAQAFLWDELKTIRAVEQCELIVGSGCIDISHRQSGSDGYNGTTKLIQ